MAHPSETARPRASAPGRRRTRFILGAALVVGGFLTALSITLPWAQFLRLGVDRGARAAGVNLRYAHGGIAWDGLELTDVVVSSLTTPPPATSFRLGRVAVAPSLWGFLSGRRGAPYHIHGLLYGGRADAMLDVAAAAWTATVRWTTIDLGTLPWPESSSRLEGQSEGELTAAQNAANPPVADNASDESTGAWTISARDVVARRLHAGNLPLPALTARELTTAGTWVGRRLAVKTLTATGPLGRVELSGRVLVRNPLDDSALGLDLTYAPPPDPPADLAPIIDMLMGPGRRDARRTYRVGGTLAAPSVTPAR